MSSYSFIVLLSLCLSSIKLSLPFSNGAAFSCQQNDNIIVCTNGFIEGNNGKDLILDFEDFSKPLKLQNKIIGFLCQAIPSCSLYMFNQFYSYVISSSPQITSLRAITTAILFFIQRYSEFEYISYQHTYYLATTSASFPIQWLWTPFIKTTIIISGESCLTPTGCPLAIENNPQMINALHSLNNEFDEFITISFIDIFYGFYFPIEMYSFFIEQCNALRQFFSLKNAYITIQCRAFILSELPLKYPKLFPMDAREELAKEAYHMNPNKSDFYILFDTTCNILTPGWLLSTISPLFYGGLYRGFGFSFYNKQLTSDFEHHTSNTIISTIMPTLTKQHFELFANETFFLPTLPYTINNLLLTASYEVVDAAIASDGVFSKQHTTIYDHSYMEDYYDQIQYNKRTIMNQLFQKNLYNVEDDYYKLRSIRLETDGTLIVHMYCDHTPGCIDASSTPIIDFSYPELSNHQMNFDSLLLDLHHWEREFMTSSSSYKYASLGDVNNKNKLETFTVNDVIPPQLNIILQGASTAAVNTEVKNPTLYPANHLFYRKYPPSSYYHLNAKVAVITAIYGAYEASCKDYAKQTVPTNFICFTDNINIINKRWIIDTIPYHLLQLYQEYMNNTIHDDDINSFHHNLHNFNIAKYYKLSFHHIPILKQYDVVIWVDGTVKITNPQTIEIILKIMEDGEKEQQNQEIHEDERTFLDQRLMTVFDLVRNRDLKTEVDASLTLQRYNSPQFYDHVQPVQPIMEQYEAYLQQGYSKDFWEDLFQSTINRLKSVNSSKTIDVRTQYGVWNTCFISFHLKRKIIEKNGQVKTVQQFLDLWYAHNRRYSTQDQVSFPFIVQTLGIYPYGLPEPKYDIYGSYDFSSLHIKLDHGQ